MKRIPRGCHITYQAQYRTCGKPECHCRKGGNERHGPYFYGFWRDHSDHNKLHSFYVGKRLPRGAALPGQRQADQTASVA